MSWRSRLFGRSKGAAPDPSPEAGKMAPARVVEAAGSTGAAPQPEQEAGWRRLTASGGAANERDLSPMAQERMQRLAEGLWQTNLLANRLIELPLAYLLAEGVALQSANEQHQAALTAFWHDPINNWPVKLESRVRALALLGEQCYLCNVGAGGKVRLGYLDPRQIATVVTDPDNAEQAIGVVTKRDTRGRVYKYRVVVLGLDADLFSERTQRIRAEDFTDGECLLYQINKLPGASRGHSDMLGQIDWLDAYDDFLFREIDRSDYLRTFAWDVTMKGADPQAVETFSRSFVPPGPNGKFVHNEQIELKAVTPDLQAADTTAAARLLRNHVLGGSTMPTHWYGGGEDVNRASASEMGEPTFKIYTMRQTTLRRMLEEIGRYVVWKASLQAAPLDWSDDANLVQAVFPELAGRDVTKFASALQQVATAVASLTDQGLLTRETALNVVADVAQRFGQEIDAKTELEAATAELEKRRADAARGDVFGLRDALGRTAAGDAGSNTGNAPAA